MNINESYDGRTWLKDWWEIVKSNFAIIKNKVEVIVSDIADINTQINDLNQAKQHKDFIVTCNVEFADKDILTITNASASYSEIKNAVENDTDVILKTVFSPEQTCYACIEEDGDGNYKWSFWRDKNSKCEIWCYKSNDWYGSRVALATEEKLSDEISDANTRIESLIDSLGGETVRIDDLTDSFSEANARINELDQKISGEITDDINLKQDKDFIVSCNAKINTADNTVTITDASESYKNIRAAYENGIDVILKVVFALEEFYYAKIDIDGDGDYRWSFWYDNNHKCEIWCYSSNDWYGYYIGLVTEEKLNDEISDANTRIESLIDSLSGETVRIDDLTDSLSDANARINELDQKISGEITDDINLKQDKDFIVTCNAKINTSDNTVTITDASASYSEIKQAINNSVDVILKVVFSPEQVYYARLASDEDGGDQYCWSFWKNNTYYYISNDWVDDWYVYSTKFATAEDVDALNTQIGDINTALENALNGGAS